MARSYDSTVARVAGNILSGMVGSPEFSAEPSARLVTVAVDLARQIVAETKRTEEQPDGSVPVRERG